MGSQFRTGITGLGVVALCFALSSLKSHHLLLAFAFASVSMAIWNWLRQISKSDDLLSGNKKTNYGQCSDLKIKSRRRLNELGSEIRIEEPKSQESKIYKFPIQNLGFSDASGQ